MWMDEFWDYIGEYGLHFVYPTITRLVMVRVACGGGPKEKSRENVRANLDSRERKLHSLVSRFMPAIGKVSFKLAIAAQAEDLLPSPRQVQRNIILPLID